MRIIAGLDIGNGYVKGKVKAEGGEVWLVDLPSTVSYTTGKDIPRDPSASYMKDFVNKLDATVVSDGIKGIDQGRVLFGKRAIHAGGSQVEFNIDDTTPKSEDSLSTFLVLGSLAGMALECFFAHENYLPETLELEVYLGLALPIEDYTDYRESYKNTLKAKKHHVHVHNFEQDCDVVIDIKDVQVLAEGAAGQYAISSLGAPFLQSALDLARSQGFEINEDYTGELLAGAENTIGVDIGEGNVNFPVFQDGNLVIESSSSINKGYGTVLSEVVSKLRNTPHSFESRKDLADFLLEDKRLPSQQHVARKVQKYVDDEVKIFVRDVLKEFSNIFRKVGLRTDVVYIYGGGANPVKEFLYPALYEASKLDGDFVVPVIYLDSAYSRDLNRNGLYAAASLASELAQETGHVE